MHHTQCFRTNDPEDAAQIDDVQRQLDGSECARHVQQPRTPTRHDHICACIAGSWMSVLKQDASPSLLDSLFSGLLLRRRCKCPSCSLPPFPFRSTLPSQPCAACSMAVSGSLVDSVAQAEEWQPLDWYAAPLYYDIIFQEETRHEARWLDELFALLGPPPLLHSSEPYPLVLEPACGSGRLVQALCQRGYRCIGFDRQAAAVDFARARCVDSAAEASTASASSAPSHPPTVFQAELTTFASTHSHLVPPSSVHLAHCLVSSLKYLPNDDAMLSHFAGVADSLVVGGLYVVALHLSDYSDSTDSVDQYTAERDGITVAASITCEPPNRANRSEQVRIRMTVTRAAEQAADAQPAAVIRYRCDETMRTYSRLELWQLLSVLTVRWFDVVATFDYEQARHGKVEAPLEWPLRMRTFDAAQYDRHDALKADWTEWKEVEAVAVVLKRR